MADDIPQGGRHALRQSPSFGTLLPKQQSKGLRRVNSDSGAGVPSRNRSWACSLCKYENVDPTKNRCALCGTQRQDSQSKGIPAVAFSSYSSSGPQKPSMVQKKNHPSSTSSDQVATPVTPERGIDSGPTPAPVIQVARSGSDPPKSDAPTNGDKTSENIGAITLPNQDVPRKAESTSSMETAEKSDEIAPLSPSADSISIRLLDLARHNSSDLTNEHESQEFDHSAVTPPFSSVARMHDSDATIPMSNVRHGILLDIDTDSMGNTERFDGASRTGDVSLNELDATVAVPEVSLNELYAMGVVPDALTADLTAQHMKKAASPSNESPPSATHPGEGDTRKSACVPLVISISPDDHNKDLEANNFQIEDPPNYEMIVGETEPQPPTSRKTIIVRAAFVALVLLVVVLSVALSVVGSDDNGDVSVIDRTPTMTRSMSPAPSGAPTMSPAPVTASPSPLPARLPTNRPTVAPTPAPTPSPTSQPTQIPTNTPTSPQTPRPTSQTAEPTIVLTT
jgi:hypothetical protein